VRKAFGQPEPPGTWANLKSTPKKLVSKLKWLGSKLKLSKYQEHAESDEVLQRHDWTHTHSLYAIMGGFVIDTRNFDCNYLPDGRQRMTLTVAGLEFIAEQDPEFIPDISESEIRDKSKANAFTKTVTCGQASWFGIQCLSRVSQGLSISLLEINTAVHAASYTASNTQPHIASSSTFCRSILVHLPIL
jgi:hypothetical protein